MDPWNNVELCNLPKKAPTVVENNNGTAPAAVSASETLQPGSDIKPKVSLPQVEKLLRRLYGITVQNIKELISYDDRNYLIQEDRNIRNPLIATPWPHGYVLKILNSFDSRKTSCIDAQNKMMIFLHKEGIQCPRPIKNVNDKFYSVEQIGGAEHVVRLLEFIPGRVFHEVEKSDALLYQSGEYIATIDQALKKFHHDVYDTHTTTWMLQAVPNLRKFTYALKDAKREALAEEIITAFEEKVLSQLAVLEPQIIHGDYNEQNIIVDLAPAETEGESGSYRVCGIIDFGDTNKSPLIFEVSIALTYMMLQAQSLARGGVFLSGYNSVLPIRAEERQYLKYCVAARLVQSVVMGNYTNSLDPTNEYVLFTQEQGWRMIDELWRPDCLASIDALWQATGEAYRQHGKE